MSAVSRFILTINFCLINSLLSLACSNHLLTSNSSLHHNNHEQFTLEIMHVNDLHSYLEPSPLTFNISQVNISALVGGVSPIASIIASKRKQNHNLIVISAGDQITGNATNYNLFFGQTDAIVQKHFQTDFYTLGNHEFDNQSLGMTTYANFVKNYTPSTKLLISNVTFAPNDPINEFINISAIKEIDGQMVAFIAITDAKKIFKSSNPAKGVTIEDATSVINQLTKELKSKHNINIFVLISHEGLAKDQKITKTLNDIDVIIGGDSHSFCGDFKKVGLETQCPYPLVKTNASGQKTCIVQAFEHAKLVGDLQVSFDALGNVTGCTGHPIMPIWTQSLTEIKQNPRPTPNSQNHHISNAINNFKKIISTQENFVEAANYPPLTTELKPFIQKIEQNFSKVVGEAKEDLCATRFPGDYCEFKRKNIPLGSETCQVFSQMLLAESKADFVLFNSGGIRSNLAPGPLTYRTLLQVSPFNMKFTTVELSGTELKMLLKEVFSYILKDPSSYDGSVPCGYGLSFTLELGSSTLNKSNPIIISNINVLHNDSNNKQQKQPIKEQKKYRLLTNDYLLKGKDGYTILKNKIPLTPKTSDLILIENYLTKHKSLPLLDNLNFMINEVKDFRKDN